jgi:pyruvate,orthophosphate dikinase
MRELLGGKGANVAEMTRVLGPGKVPPGFTITTEACVEYMSAGRREPDGLAEQVTAALAALEARAGKRLGDPDDPLLVSVRSGARESMPGMMDTVLNLGLNDRSVAGLAARTGNPRFALDAYRRFVQMFANVCRGISSERLEAAIAERKRAAGVRDDSELSEADLRVLVGDLRRIYEAETGEAFPRRSRGAAAPGDPSRLRLVARQARRHLPRINHIPDEWGTACNVQQMVFGNKGDTSCSGVAFSRDEVTGAPEPSGDFLVNAQGEDVVSGVRTPRDLAEMADAMPEAHAELRRILRALEAHYKDMQDTEFTVEEGELYMLQTRDAKRPAQAAVRFAVDAVEEGLLTRGEAIDTIDAAGLDAPAAPDVRARRVLRGARHRRRRVAGRGQGTDRVHARRRRRVGTARARGRSRAPVHRGRRRARLLRRQGILTAEGGKASHAALVARGMGKPCVAGASALRIDLDAGVAARRRDRAARGRPDRDRRLTGSGDRRRRRARRARDQRRVSRPCWPGQTSCAGWVCAPTPTPHRMPRGRASSARRASASAARAHVHGGRSPAQDAGDDHGRVHR